MEGCVGVCAGREGGVGGDGGPHRDAFEDRPSPAETDHVSGHEQPGADGRQPEVQGRDAAGVEGPEGGPAGCQEGLGAAQGGGGGKGGCGPLPPLAGLDG